MAASLGSELDTLVADLTGAVSEYKAAAANEDQLGGDLATRMKVITTAQKIVHATKKPEEQWYDQSVWMADLTATRIFKKWEAFAAIPAVGEGSISYEDLAKKLDADTSLVRRIAWVLVSTGTLKQIGTDKVENTTKSMVYVNNDSNGMMFQIMYDEALRPYVFMSEYFEKYGRREPSGQTDNPYSFGYQQPEKTAWEIMAAEPARVDAFMRSMDTMEQHLPITGYYDFSWVKEKLEAETERTALVDVGGSRGHAIKAICAETEYIKGAQCVLEDLPQVIEQVKTNGDEALKNVKLQVHDFFTEQPIKGALIYWIRRVLHDHNDTDCAKILTHLADAMAPDSRVLIVDQIMENPPPPLVAQTDFCMLTISGKERTREMFEELVGRAGLKVLEVHLAKGTPVGVVECIKI
ncbi:O-methyltransferase [Microthyrium microscopicum]|uniref:O-methyltransferase n=1 Tax=Microthyrium microscopicum TaxID=703497 RepID=A0A6A6UDD4_9PEZI|nr:O-methyltransferase [Microthyrium microscopicum]